jgi:dihydroorotate dehydrogenase (fumarate)
MVDLTTSYMGLRLKNPLVASASPLSHTLAGIKALEKGGAGAIVLFSLFEEQIHHESALFEHLLTSGTQSFAESLDYFPSVNEYDTLPEQYLALIAQAKASVNVPIIGSLNGMTHSGWIQYAKKIEQAGADALELNIFYIPDVTHSSAEIEQRYVDIVKTVKSVVSIPVALKLSPFFSSTGNLMQSLDNAGADGLVLFNRFYQPDFDIQTLTVNSTLHLSSNEEIRLPLLWIAMLHGKVQASLAATRGVETSVEVIKYLLAGANVVMTTSALLRHGTDYLGVLLAGLEEWMLTRGYASVDEMRGVMSQQNVANPEAFERANYIRILEGFKE